MILQKTYQTLLLYLLLIVVAVLYSASLTAEPLTWNDDAVLSHLGAMQKGNASAWNHTSVRPLPLGLFSYLHSFGDGSIFLFHAVNILSHAVNIVLIFYLLVRFNQSFPVSFIAAAMFGVHSIHAGTVSWISQFPVIFSLTILLISAHAYVSYCRTDNRLFLLLVGILAAIFHLTVNGGIQFVILLCGIDILERGHVSQWKVYQKIPFLLLGVVSVAISDPSLNALLFESLQFVRFGIVEGIIKVAAFTQSSGVSPLQDTVDRSMVSGYSIFPMLVPFIILLVLWTGREQKVIVFSFFGFLFFGMPVLSWAEGGEWMLNSEKYYVCSLFLFFPISYYSSRLYKNVLKAGSLQSAAISAAVLLFCVMSVQTYRSVHFRTTNLSYWTYLNDEYPGNAFVLNNIGTYHFSKYEIDPATSYLSQSINAHPKNYESYNYRGLVYLSIYHMDSAKADFKRAIEINPRYALAYYNLSTAYGILSDWENAIASCSKAIELQPDFVQAYNNRANIYAKQKKYVEAFADYETAVRIDAKYPDIYGNRALIYLETGNATNAIWNFKRQSDLVPRRFDVMVNLGLTCIMAGDSVQALFAFSNAAQLDSANAKMYLSAVQSTFLRDREEIELLKRVLFKIKINDR